MSNILLKENHMEKLILDTHMLIWYLEGIELSQVQVELIEAQRMRGQLYISAITIWEVTMLINKQKIALSLSLHEWVSKVAAIEGLNILDLSINILVESCHLPNYGHQDPADRLIIASSRAINAHLLTLDQKILTYANDGYLKIC